MITRILPRVEWPRLAGTECEALWPVLPEDARIVVVEDDGAIVACWAVYPLVHVEGLWIAPTHRKRPGVGLRLLRAAVRVAHRMGAKAVQTAALDNQVVAFARRLGAVELRGRHFSLRIDT